MRFGVIRLVFAFLKVCFLMLFISVLFFSDQTDVTIFLFGSKSSLHANSQPGPDLSDPMQAMFSIPQHGNKNSILIKNFLVHWT